MNFFGLSQSWTLCYMAQMNPLLGPKLHQNTILIMAREWGKGLPDMDTYIPSEKPLGDNK